MYDFLSSGAFVETFTLEPNVSGVLDGLSFAVKDNIDIAGYKTSYGSNAWKESHPACYYNALCVEQLLGAGATCLGKTVSDEFTYSLDGENYYFGTPINPAAPDRVPGGSSSGSASAVACGLVDFSLGTDSAGSIRVPASLCGVYGMRPTMHRISEAGVLPFVPSSSTVGALAGNINTLDKVMRVLLRSEDIVSEKINNIYVLEDAFSISDLNISALIKKRIKLLSESEGVNVTPVFLHEIIDERVDLEALNVDVLRPLQTFEFMNTVGSWIESASPEQSPFFAVKYKTVRGFSRKEVNTALLRCEKYYKRIHSFIKKGDLLVFPTVPTIAPLKGSLQHMETALDFYDRTMAITSFSGVGRLPEITFPVGVINNAPVGMSVVAGFYQDEFLIAAMKKVLAKFAVSS